MTINDKDQPNSFDFNCPQEWQNGNIDERFRMASGLDKKDEYEKGDDIYASSKLN